MELNNKADYDFLPQFHATSTQDRVDCSGDMFFFLPLAHLQCRAQQVNHLLKDAFLSNKPSSESEGLKNRSKVEKREKDMKNLNFQGFGARKTNWIEMR